MERDVEMELCCTAKLRPPSFLGVLPQEEQSLH